MLIGLNHLLFDILDHNVTTYCLTIVVRRNKDDWTQMITVIYGPNHIEDRPNVLEEQARVGNQWM